jgi:DNA-binding transcriptional MerR regulator
MSLLESRSQAQPQAQPKRERLLRIGEVERRLREEFPDISISKIRFLEDEGLISPQRTPSGYRLFDESDLERLVTILRLQRDEFLPLRVIRDELAVPGASERKRRRPVALGERVELIELGELCRRAGITLELAKELEDFGLLAPLGSGADKRYPETDADVAMVCAQLVRFGVDGRHLRTFRTATDREASLLDQLIAPALRSRNAERRAAGLADLQSLTELAQELVGLLLWREVREIAAR